MTPYALDGTIKVADTDDENIVTPHQRLRPAVTDLPPDPNLIDRFANERILWHTVEFHGFSRSWRNSRRRFVKAKHDDQHANQ